MTTIAVKDGVMASDSRAVSDHIHQGNFTKIYRAGSALIGFAGRATTGLDFVAWYKAGAKRKKFPASCDEDDWYALVLTGSGCFMYEGSPTALQAGNPAAIGSGSQFAIGAMLAGCDPKEAVKIASRADPFTGGRIVTRTL